jgi:hypothetical protein
MRSTQQEPEAPAAPQRAVVNRRSALRLAGIGLGSVAAVGVGAGGVRAASNGVFSAGSGDPYDLWRDWAAMSGVDRVVAAGVLAANPHNTQPWRFAVSGDVVDLHADPGRRMPVNDASDREHFAGLGSAIENMVVAAGGDAEVALFPEGTASEHVARIALGAGGSGRDRALAEAIPDRHTNRGPYTGEPVDLTGFAEQASRIPGAEVVWITDRAARDRLGALYVDIDEHRDGLTLDGQGLGGLTLPAAKILPAQSRTDGDAFWLGATRDVHTATAAAYGVVVVDDAADRTAQVVGGRLLARMHLTATALGLGFHPMNQITERIDRDRALGARDAFSDRWAAVLGRPASTGLVSFRIGHPERAPGLSPRRALADVVTR